MLELKVIKRSEHTHGHVAEVDADKFQRFIHDTTLATDRIESLELDLKIMQEREKKWRTQKDYKTIHGLEADVENYRSNYVLSIEREEKEKEIIAAVREQIGLMPQSGSGYDYWVQQLLKALERSNDLST